MSPAVKIVLGIQVTTMVAYGFIQLTEGQAPRLAAAQLLLAVVTWLVYA